MLACAGMSSAQSRQPFSPPDALIIVQPTGSVAVVTVSYAGKVPHTAAKGPLERLAKLGGWKMTTPEVADVDMKTSTQYGPSVNLGPQTGATAIISGAPLAKDGGFRLQPFVEAFHGMRSFRLLFWVAAQPGFQGLRSFDSPAVAVDLLQDGGPYRYSVVNHTQEGAVPLLPLTQARLAAEPNSAAKSPASTNPTLSTVVPIVAISVGSGIIVFLMLRLLSLARARGRNGAVTSRTTSRDSHHTSRV
jgi:hypothetical protein